MRDRQEAGIVRVRIQRRSGRFGVLRRRCAQTGRNGGTELAQCALEAAKQHVGISAGIQRGLNAFANGEIFIQRVPGEAMVSRPMFSPVGFTFGCQGDETNPSLAGRNRLLFYPGDMVLLNQQGGGWK